MADYTGNSPPALLDVGRFILQAGSPDYFATVGTRIVRGRRLDSGDRAHTHRIAVVSEGMARVLWPGRDAIGECFRIGPGDVPCTSVVGIAEDIRIRSLTDDREFTYALRGLIDSSFRSWKFGATMFLAFGGLALTLAAIGLYGVIAYNV